MAVETEIGEMWSQPRNAGATEVGGGKERILPEGQEEHGPPTPSFQPSDTGIEAVRE